MKNFFRFLSIGIVMIGVIPRFALEDLGFAKRFPDIRSDSDLERKIEYLIKRNIITGYPDGTFKPEQTINRAEALKMIFASIGATPRSELLTSNFPDVPPHQWYTPYVAEGQARNIISGYPDGKFHPEEVVNRAEFVKMAVSSLPFSAQLTFDTSIALRQFSDIDYRHWYIPYLSTALALDFIKRVSEFKPTHGMQRQDAVEIISSISNYLEKHPQPADKNSTTPYIPEEAFVKINPLSAKHYNPETFGPEKLFVKKDINKTDITNTYAGYAITIDEIVNVENFERSPNRMTLTYDRGCVVDIERENTDGKTPQQIFAEELDNSRFMDIPKKKWLEKIHELETVEAYQIGSEWSPQKRNEYTLIYTPDHYYIINGFSVSSIVETECDKLGKILASQFSPLRP